MIPEMKAGLLYFCFLFAPRRTLTDNGVFSVEVPLVLLLMYLALGAVAGVMAGLLGVGGGAIIVPVLIYSFVWQGMPESVLTHLAVGTSLATIAVTSVSSVRAHHLHGAVLWRVFLWMVPGIVVGVWLGANIANSLSGANLQLGFGIFLLCISIQMGLSLQPKSEKNFQEGPALLPSSGIIGVFSAMFGIGGGLLTVPYLSWRGVVMQKAVATSAAVGLPIAIVGALTNIVVAWGREGLPAYSSGYVYWPAFFGIVLTSAYCARYGAKLAHNISPQQLKRGFAIFAFIISIHFIVKNL
jgi:uncharacterized protein